MQSVCRNLIKALHVDDDYDDYNPPSSDSEFSSYASDEDDELYISSRGVRYMDASKTPLPSIPTTQKQVKQYVLKLNFEIEGINASRLTDKVNRFQKPSWKGHGKKRGGSKRKRYKKQLKIFEELDRGILRYIRCTALASNHQLKKHLGRIKFGIEAYDFVLGELDPISYDRMSSSADAVSTFEALQLTSTSTGSFSMFQIQFMDCLDDLAANSISYANDDNYLKLTLLNKLPHAGYKHIFLHDGIFDGLTFKETLAKIAKTAVHVEHEGKPSGSKGGSRVAPTNSSSTKEIPEEIGGFKVDNNGIVGSEDWNKMSHETRRKYWDAKNKLRDDGVIFPKKGERGGSGKSKPTENENSSEQAKSQARIIKKLEKKLKAKEDADEGSAAPTSPKESDKANINKLTFAEVLKRMPKENASKA